MILPAAAAIDGPLVVARALHFGSCMILCGATFFAAALAPQRLRDDLHTRLKGAAVALAVAALLSALGWFYLVARSMAGDDPDLDALSEVAFATAFGRVWTVRLALLAALPFIVILTDRCWRAPALAAGAAVASLGLVGHAAMQEGGLGAAHRLNHAIHLLAASAWIGGLPPFLAALRRRLRAPERRDALEAMVRFSRVGHVFVAAVFVTGALDAAMTLQVWPWPPESPYRLGLFGKAAIFAAMTLAALLNRYRFAPNMAHNRSAADCLAAGAVANMLLGAAALALASLFATFAPR